MTQNTVAKQTDQFLESSKGKKNKKIKKFNKITKGLRDFKSGVVTTTTNIYTHPRSYLKIIL